MLLEKASLTPNGRPEPLHGEVEQLLLDKVDLEFEVQGGVAGAFEDRYKGGYVILTNRRVVWIDAEAAPAAGRSCSLPLTSVASASQRTSFALQSKVRLELHVHVDSYSKPAPASQGHSSRKLALRCRGPSPDSFKEALMAAVAAALAAGHMQQAQQQQQQAQHASWTSRAALPVAPGRGGSTAADDGVVSPVDPVVLQAIVDMGFQRSQAARALAATGSTDIQEAIDWILAFGDEVPTSPPGPPSPTRPAYAASVGDAAGRTTPSSTSSSPLRDALRQRQGMASPQLYPGLPSSSAVPSPPPYPAIQPLQDAAFANPLLAAAVGPPQEGPRSGTSSSRPVGVAGLVQLESGKAAATGSTLQQAFQDLHALMAMAQQMVQLAEKFRGVLAQVEPGGPDDMMDVETQLQLVSLGVASPVTKETAGARYHVELARQLADVLQEQLRRAGGMVPLPEVYCLFNRARGTELVSPDDLLKAVQSFPAAGVQLRLRQFASGVTVVQGPQHSDEQVCSRLAQLVAPPAGGGLGKGITTTDAAAALQVPLGIAAEHLLLAEARGVLVRDDSPSGLCFYRNFFVEV